MTSQRQRIVFVLPTFLAGGAERVLITLMNTLDRKKFEPHLIVINETGTLNDLVAADIPVHPLGRTKLRFALPSLIFKLNALQPDIVFSTMAGTNFLVLLSKNFTKKKCRIIVREAVVPSSIINKQKFPALLQTAYKQLYPKADLVISPAQIIIDEFKNNLGLDTTRHVLLFNPVDANTLRSGWMVGDATSVNRHKTVNFIAAGRLHEQKGFDRLINALPSMNLPFDWNLSILGTGLQQEFLETLIKKHGLENKITLRGLVKSPWALYAEANAFLLPSRWEGLPNVALESLAVGTPVIAMKEAGGIGEIAALAPKGAVTVTTAMHDFIKEMERVTPNPATGFRPSLLPAAFELQSVVRRFEELLTGGKP